jgi:hypothetical protein
MRALTNVVLRRIFVSMKSLGLALGWLLVGLAACGPSDVCLDYACVNAAKLSGTVTVSAPPTQVDVSFCSQSECHTGSVDLSQSEAQSCAYWDGSSVCITAKETALEVTAVWDYRESEAPPPDGTEYHLQLTNHETGDSLLDAKRTTSYAITREDSCHRCFSGAEMSF